MASEMAIRHAVAQSCKERLEHPAAAGTPMAIRIEPILIGLLVGGVKEEKIPEEEERRKKIGSLYLHWPLRTGFG